MDSPIRTSPPAPTRTRVRIARATSIFVPIAVVVAVALCTGGIAPGFGTAPGRECRAAVTIRDDVSPFQKWGTRAFTIGQLRANYDRVDYFSQSADRDRRAEFVAALERALARYDAVDVFLLAHRNSFVSWMSALDTEARGRIRLVYNSGCFGAKQAADWLDAGADVYVGHPGRSESPVFYVSFLRRWLRGLPIDESVAASNEDTRRVLAATGGVLYRGRPFRVAWDATRAVAVGDAGLSISGVSLP